jgi:hypothetical protein
MKWITILVILAAVFVSSALQAGEWYEKIKFGGDFRDRYDGIKDETKDYNRHRNRIRARLSMTATVSSDFTFISRFATGVNYPSSTNRTLTDAFTAKESWLDLAYFAYHPAGVKGFYVFGGKMKSTFYKPGGSQLIWDSDVNPEGLAVKFGRNASEKISYFLAGSWYSVMEGKENPDVYMIGAQGGMNIAATEKIYVQFGANYFGYENMKGSTSLYGDEFFGNTSVDDDGTEVFAYDYRLVEGFGEVGFKAGKATWTVYGSYVNNTAVDDFNTGWIAGLSVKSGKGRGAWKVNGFYKQVEADGVIGLFADSDFGGGITDVEGFAISGGYGFNDYVGLASTLFVNQQGIGEGTDFTRLFIDFNLKF